MKGDFADQLDTPVPGEDKDRPPKRHVPEGRVGWHALGFFILIVAAIGGLTLFLSYISCTPGVDKDAPCTCAADESVLVALVIAAGAIGGLIHAATSFATFAGNRELLASWIFWLYLRAPLGVLLALLVYLAIRAGIFGDMEVATCAGVYKVAFFAGLSGLFSKQVADKLSDLVDNLFLSSKPPNRADALEHTQTSDETKTAQAGAGEQAKFEEIIRKVQQCLIKLGHLPARNDGGPSDDGILTDATRDAINRFFAAEGITAEERLAAFGEEADPDYWPKLLEQLEGMAK